jgi:TonB-dependent SusC/RagA subfamily outer membrane receptor
MAGWKPALLTIAGWKPALLLLALCCSAAIYAQSGVTLRGKVIDTSGEPLAGAVVTVIGSTRGAATDENGEFELTNVTRGAKLKATFLGMKDREFVYDGKNNLTIVLEDSSKELEEVTVVAFGTQKKESVVSSIQTVRPGELRVPSSNLTTALAGRVAGLISYQRSGEPGADNAEFFVRGVTTFGTGKANPLILIDGVEMTNDDLARLTVDDIASFSIMKDANATALYGARGADSWTAIYHRSEQSWANTRL